MEALGGMNEKQRLKEFKRVAKELKSKDPSVREKAIQVAFDEPAYLVEGKGLLSLLEGVAAKKKVLELSCVSLEALDQLYLSMPPEEDSTENDIENGEIGNPPSSHARILINLIVENNENLNLLQNVSDLVHFKTEVKKKPGVPDDVEGMALEEKCRHVSAKALALIASDILSMPHSQPMCDFFHGVPSITESVCAALKIAHTSFQDEERKESSLEYINDLLCSLCLLVTYSSFSVEYLLASEVMAYLPELVKETKLKLNALRIYKAVLKYTSDERIDMQHLDAVIEVLESTYPVVAEAFTSAPVDPKAKGKPAKGAPPPQEETVETSKTPLHLLSCLAVIAEILIEYSKADLITSEEHVEKIVKSYDAVVLLPDVWNILHQPQVFHDFKLGHLCHYVCILFGTIATVGKASQRTKICQSGGVKLLTSMMRESNGIVGGVSEEGTTHHESSKSLIFLRRLAEQAILFLLTTEKNKGGGEKNQENEGMKGEPVEESCTDGQKVIDFSVRQMGDSFYETDQTLFLLPNGESEPIVPFTLLADLLSCEDHDISARATRAVGIIISNSPDPVDFVNQLDMASSVVEMLSKLVGTHSSAMLESPEISDSLNAATALQEDATNADSTSGATDELKQEGIKQTMDEILTPRNDEVLCWLLRIFDVLCRLSPANIDSYSTQENVSNLAKLISITGPTGCDNVSPERIVDVFDVRTYPWDEIDSRPLTNVVFRSYIFDIFALVAGSDAQLREYTTGTIPTPPGEALSESTLSTESSVQTVNKWVIDAAIGVILIDSGFETSSSKQLKVSPSKFSILNVSVLNSALSYLLAVSTSGVFGIETAIESVSLPLIEDSQKSSISIFKSRLARAMPEIAEILPTLNENDLYSSSPEVLKPIHFDSALAEVAEHMGEEDEGENLSVIHPASTLMMTSENLSNTQKLWPFIILSSALLGVLNRPDYTAKTTEIAFSSVCGFCKSSQFKDENQPAINDLFSAVFICLGGGVTLSAISGKFGCLKNRQANIEFLDFLFRRGISRETFWANFAETHGSDEVAAVPPAKGKAPPPKKGSPEPTQGYPVLPDEHHQDPSHGPTFDVWSYILSQVHDDVHTHSVGSTASIVCLQGMLTNTALTLTECGVDSNVGDVNGVTPLMYALLLNNAAMVDSLIAAEADVDATDNDGNPVIKYALLSIPNDSIENEDIPSTHCTNAPSIFDASDANCRSFKADATLLDKVITAGVDLRVCDADGNFPLQIVCSFGFLYISIGGYFIELRSKFYSSLKLNANGSYEASPMREMSLLIENGADVDSCNKSGITPLHICAGFSDLDAMNLLVTSKATVNTLDFYGFLPLHYCISCCQDNVMRAMELLLDAGVNSNTKTAEFIDKRTGLSTQEKNIVDLETSLNEIFLHSVDPPSITYKRISNEEELLLLRTIEGANILQLVLSAETLMYDNLRLFFTSENPTRKNRESMLDYIFNRVPPSNKEFYLNVDSMGTSVLHAATLFFVGDTEIQHLCPKRRINPIKYGNLELQLLDYIFSNDPGYDVNTLSTRPIIKLKETSSDAGWFPVTGAISSNNVAFVKFLVEHGVDLNKCNANDFVQQYLDDDASLVGIKGLLSMRGEMVEVGATIHDVAVQEVAKLELTRPRSRDSATSR